MRATTSSLLIAIPLCLSAVIPTSALQEKGSTWKDRDGKVRSLADLDQILVQHKLWVKSGGKSGSRADLRSADLRSADLSFEDLSHADLRSADLHGAGLTATSLGGADLGGADLRGADLKAAYLSATFLGGADLSSANLDVADLRGADLRSANLSGASLQFAHLRDVHLYGANLNGADLRGAELLDADLRGADLSSVALFMANLAGAAFEPKNLPILEEIAQAQSLELMTYGGNPGPLTRLRKQFQDAGYREQERAITYALNRHDADPSKLRASVEAKFRVLRGRPKPLDEYGIVPLRSFVEGAFKWIAFDLTCQYGFSPGRPLRIVGVLGLFFSIVYAIFIHWRGSSGIYLVGTRWSRGRSNT